MLEPGKKADAIPTPRAPERLGRYELVTRIGAGALAEVFLARQPAASGAEKIAAVHRIHPHLARVKEFVEVLLDEARAAALLEHPRVVDIYDLGVARGVYFIAMEYLAGQTLEAVLDPTRRDGAPLDVMSAARIVADAAEGLHAAHQLRSLSGRPLDLVHRDVCPRTIVVLHDGNVKLVDFGVARARALIAGGRAGSAPAGGRAGYASPEQAAGEPLDRRSDVYSLGVVLWEALALRPFEEAFKHAAAPTAVAPADGASSAAAQTEAMSSEASSKEASSAENGANAAASSEVPASVRSSQVPSSDDGWDELPAGVPTVSAPPTAAAKTSAPTDGSKKGGRADGSKKGRRGAGSKTSAVTPDAKPPADTSTVSAPADASKSGAGGSSNGTSPASPAPPADPPANGAAVVGAAAAGPMPATAPASGPVAPSAYRAEVPPELDRICLRALARDPAARFQTAAEMQAEIEAVLAAAAFRRQDGAIASFLARGFTAEREAGEALIRGALEPPDPILARGTARRRTGSHGAVDPDARPAVVGPAPGQAASPGTPAASPMTTPAPSSPVPGPLGARRDGAVRPEALFPAARVPVGKVPVTAPVGVVPMPGSRPNGAPATRGRGASGSQAEGADAVTEVSELLTEMGDGATEVAEAATHVVAAAGRPVAVPAETSSSTSMDVILPDGDADALAAAGPARGSVAGNDLAPRSGETVVGPSPAMPDPGPAGAEVVPAQDAATGPVVQTMDDTIDVEENITDADLGSRPRGKGRTGRIEAITGAWSDSRRLPTARPLPLPAPPSADRRAADAARASSAGDTEDDDDDFTVVDPEKSPRAFEAAAAHAAALAGRAAAAAPTSQTAAIPVPAAADRSRPILPAHRARPLWVAALVGVGAVAVFAAILYAALGGTSEDARPGAGTSGAANVVEPSSSAAGNEPVSAPGAAASAPARGGAAKGAPIAPPTAASPVSSPAPGAGAAPGRPAAPTTATPIPPAAGTSTDRGSPGASSPGGAASSPSGGAASSPSGGAASSSATATSGAGALAAPSRRQAERSHAASGGSSSRPQARAAREKPRTAAAAPREPKPRLDPDQLYRDGARLFLAGELDQARRAFQGAIAAAPRFAPAHRGLGLVYERTGDRPRAIRSLQTYLRLAPSAADADAIRTRLDRLRR